MLLYIYIGRTYPYTYRFKCDVVFWTRTQQSVSDQVMHKAKEEIRDVARRVTEDKNVAYRYLRFVLLIQVREYNYTLVHGRR